MTHNIHNIIKNAQDVRKQFKKKENEAYTCRQPDLLADCLVRIMPLSECSQLPRILFEVYSQVPYMFLSYDHVENYDCFLEGGMCSERGAGLELPLVATSFRDKTFTNHQTFKV